MTQVPPPPTARAIWRPLFLVLWALWSLLIGGYVLHADHVDSRWHALLPWLGGTAGAGVLCLIGRGLQLAVQSANTLWQNSHTAATTAAPASVATVAEPSAPVLQIRACHARLGQQDARSLAALLQTGEQTAPLLAQPPPDPTASLAKRGMMLQAHLGLGMEMLNTALPDAAPVAVFTLAPPITEATRRPVAEWAGLVAATQGHAAGPLLLRELDHHGPSLAPLLQAISARFTSSPTLCSAVLLSLDGQLIRGHYRAPEPDQPLPVHDSMVMLWITRAELPDTLRRQAVDADSSEGRRARQPLLWWRKELDEYSTLFPDEPEARVHAAAFTQSLLQDWKRSQPDSEARRVGDDLWYPAPWTTQHVQQFDAAPVLASLPPPLHLPLRDADGTPLPPLARENAINEGWKTACARLPADAGPPRIWHDRQGDAETALALRMALRSLTPRIDLDDPQVGVDLGKRLGPLGSGSGAASLAIALAQGGAHMVVISDGEGGLLLQPLFATPPADADTTPHTAGPSSTAVPELESP